MAQNLFMAIASTKTCKECTKKQVSEAILDAIDYTFVYMGRNSISENDKVAMVVQIMEINATAIQDIHLSEFKHIFIQEVNQVDLTDFKALSAAFFCQAIRKYVYAPNAPRIEAKELIERIKGVGKIEVKEVSTLEVLETAYEHYPKSGILVQTFDWLKEMGLFASKERIRAAFEAEVDRLATMTALTQQERLIKTAAVQYVKGTKFSEISPILKQTAFVDAKINLCKEVFDDWKKKGFESVEEALKVKAPDHHD